jgi:hypothetical protein
MRFLGRKQQKKKARAKTKAMIQSLRLAGFAPAFGRAEPNHHAKSRAMNGGPGRFSPGLFTALVPSVWDCLLPGAEPCAVGLSPGDVMVSVLVRTQLTATPIVFPR